MSGRIAVGVSGTGSNLRALVAAAERGVLGGDVALVFADRACPGLDWAAEQGIDTVLVPGGDDAILAETLAAVAPDAVVLAGYLRLVGPAVLAAFGGRILNVHPSLLPSFPGPARRRDALAAGVAVTGVTVHLVDATLDGGPDRRPGGGAGPPRRHRGRPPRAPPRGRAPAAAGGRGGAPGRRAGGRRWRAPGRLDSAAADARMPVPRRALLSVSDKTGLADLGRGLVARGFELVSTGGTARALREAGLPVTDVAAVTGFPEMLDGRVKTLHPRVHGGILADRRRADHREALLAAGIAPFDLVVVNLYPFAAAARKPGLSFDELVEEIDIGGPSMVRAAAKNHATVAIVTSPARYEAVLAALDAHGSIPLGLRSALAVEAFRHTAAYDARIAAELPGPHGRRRRGASRGARPAGLGRPVPAGLTVSLEKVETLRYGENPHQPAARYRRTDREPRPGDGPFASGEPPLQGKALSYNNVLDASAAAALARLMRGPAIVIVQAHEPVRRRGAPDSARGLGRGPGRRPGLRVRGRRGRHRDRGPAARRAARVDLPGGGRRAGVRRGGAGGAGDQAQPAAPGGPSLGSGDGERRRRPARLLPHRRRRRARHRAGHPPRRSGRLDVHDGRVHRRRPSCGTWTSPGVSAGASSRTRSCSSVTACWSVSAPAR